MKKRLLLILITIISFNCYSQISFEKGYFIDNTNKKTECLIKNVDWKNNPTTFEYKLSESSEIKNQTIKYVKEFGIDNISKYNRHNVDMDRSSDITGDLSDLRVPKFKQEELFLKTLVEGKASLYYYEEGNLKRFFFNIDNSTIEQLVYKRYNVSESTVGKNNRYKQQLLNILTCEAISNNVIIKLNYEKSKLVNLFVKYNECINPEFTNFVKKKNTKNFNLTIRPGLNNGSLIIENSKFPLGNADFGNKLGYRIGLEAELIMPFNRNKWSLIIESIYLQYKSELEENEYPKDPKAEYNSIALSLGIRHYLFLNNMSKIYINGTAGYDLHNTSTIISNQGQELDVSSTLGIGLGIGFKCYEKYSLELKYNLSKNILGNYVLWNADYKNVSLIFGYTLL